MTNVALLLALRLLASPASAPVRALLAGPPARDSAVFRLHKFQQPIGIERSILVTNPDGTVDVRTTFAFTDRNASVPLASNLTLAADGTPRRFAIWGSTSRGTTVDDKVELADGKLTIDQTGASRVEAAPRDFFVGSQYAPVILTELLWRHWSAHGRPHSIKLYPSGEARIEPRGSETITGDDGKPHRLDRYALSGRVWGRETFWIDEQGKLAAYKGVDAEFDHFEAIRRGYQDALGAFVKSAAADGVAALREQAQSAASPEERGPVAYVGAKLIDTTGAAPVPDSVVLVERGRITAAGPSAHVSIPAGAKRIDVAGKTIVPGLWDMHAHFEQVEWGPVYLAAGVTTARDCGNEMDFITSVRDTVDAGKGLGPRLLLACFVDGYGTGSIGTSRLREEAGIPALIKGFQDARCSQVKIYSSLEPKLIAPLAHAAHAAGLSVTGHIPDGIGAVAAVEAGMDQINHVGFVVRALLPVESPDAELSNAETERALASLDFQSEKTRSTLALLKARGVIVDPTVSLSELFSRDAAAMSAVEPGLAKVAPQLKEALETMGPSPDRAARAALWWKASLGTVRALHQAGIPIVAGTDQAVPGHSLHREMELYVEAGFTPMEALQAATIVPARAMKRDKDLGTIEPGKIADFLVVDGDPLADIRNLRKIITVVKDGRPYDPPKLWRMVGFEP
jgi:imidazolonepropionase-like amidohydrolase